MFVSIKEYHTRRMIVLGNFVNCSEKKIKKTI